MSIKKRSSSELKHIVHSFIPEILVNELEVQQLGLGHIHDSYLIQQSGTPSWILQKLNTQVFTKPEQIEKNHQVDLPQHLIDQEISIMTQNLKSEDKEKHKSNNEKLAKSIPAQKCFPVEDNTITRALASSDIFSTR